MTISSTGVKSRDSRRSIGDLLVPLNELATRSVNLVANHEAHFEIEGETYNFPRYLFIGSVSGEAPIRVGIFATIHGDEPEGAHAIAQFIEALEGRPEFAAGYYLSFYPLCNPTGYEDNTSHSRNGSDLDREFWKNSKQPEVQLLQAELVSQSFQGIISLRTDATSDGFYALVRGGGTLAKHLVEPSLRAVDEFLPRDSRLLIDGLRSRDGIVRDEPDGRLSAPPKVRPRPFEIVLTTPKAPPAFLKESALIVALQTILAEYRRFIAHAQNI